MPTDSCRFYHECSHCKAVLRGLDGDEEHVAQRLGTGTMRVRVSLTHRRQNVPKNVLAANQFAGPFRHLFVFMIHTAKAL